MVVEPSPVGERYWTGPQRLGPGIGEAPKYQRTAAQLRPCRRCKHCNRVERTCANMPGRNVWPDNDTCARWQERSEQDTVTCNACGFVGTVAEFMALDPHDSICPNPECNEKQEHTYTV